MGAFQLSSNGGEAARKRSKTDKNSRSLASPNREPPASRERRKESALCAPAFQPSYTNRRQRKRLSDPSQTDCEEYRCPTQREYKREDHQWTGLRRIVRKAL